MWGDGCDIYDSIIGFSGFGQNRDITWDTDLTETTISLLNKHTSCAWELNKELNWQ